MDARFVRIGKGRLTLYHRMGRRAYSALVEQGCTHIVTLLRDDEGAFKTAENARTEGIQWIWAPVPNGKTPDAATRERLLQTIAQVSDLLDQGASVLVHCSAGIHRTGMFGYGLLRWRGLSKERALELIAEMRPETGAGILPRQIAWGDSIARQEPQKGTWLSSTIASASRWLIRIFKRP